MGIREIDACDAQLLVPHRDPLLQFFAVEKAWYASDDDELLGTVIYCRATKSWSYIVLGNDERGLYRWIAGEIDLGSQQEATERLHGQMEEILRTGQHVFRRPLKVLLEGIRMRRHARQARRAARRAPMLKPNVAPAAMPAASANHKI
jgi:hypothetical protein